MQHTPIRKLGQNFLIDPNIVRKSLQLAQVRDGDQIVEVGPGLGTLSRALLETGARVFAVEKDPSLAGWLRKNLQPRFPETFHLLEGDALKYPLAGRDARSVPFKVVANLPYAISTPWLERVLSGPLLPESLVLMLQKETADRFAASPGSKNFSAITVFLQHAYSFAPGHRVSARCFYPPPKVDSYLLHLRRKDQPGQFSAPQRDLLRRLFTQRRKQLGRVLREAEPTLLSAWEQILEEQGFSLRQRPEEIPTPLWAALLAERNKNP